MEYLALLFLLPVVSILLSVTLPSTRMVATLAIPFAWAQPFITAYMGRSVLTGTNEMLTFTPDIAGNRLAILFVMVTQIVVAAATTHARVLFQSPRFHTEEYARYIRIFYACTTAFMMAMTMVFLSNNLGFLWIAIETTTLCSVPLVYFNHDKHALEAAWKYLIICSVGIAFALLGTVLIFASGQRAGIDGGTLNLSVLNAHATSLQYPLLRLGFIFCFLGFGTKAGIFPLHNWLPDAHSEAPAPASAMLSGSLLNCALFAIWRLSQLLTASGHEALPRDLALTLGGITVAAASLLLIRQHALKRLLAYSSIENVGLMLVAIGLGSGPLFLLQAVNHTAAKVALFCIAGNIIEHTGAKSIDEIRGLISYSPYWALLLILGAFAVTGSPPFGAFIAEWQILATAGHQHLGLLIAVLIAALAISFLAVAMHIGKVITGTPKNSTAAAQPIISSAVPALLVVFTLVTGLTAIPYLRW